MTGSPLGQGEYREREPFREDRPAEREREPARARTSAGERNGSHADGAGPEPSDEREPLPDEREPARATTAPLERNGSHANGAGRPQAPPPGRAPRHDSHCGQKPRSSAAINVNSNHGGSACLTST